MVNDAMRIWLSFSAIAFLLSVLSGCSVPSPSKLDSVFPPKIGQFDRRTMTENSGPWFTAEYYKRGAVILYGFGLEKTAEAAQEKVKRKEFCDGQYSSQPKILKEEILKDKAGKEIGNILICREPNRGFTGNKYEFKMTLANDKTYVLLDTKIGGLAELVEFAQALPVNSQVDFAALNMDELIAENPSTSGSPEELIKLNPPLQLAAKPYLKGKVLIVEQHPREAFLSTGAPSVVESPERYGLTKELMTQSITQAGTLIQIKCGKGKKINEYVTQDAEKKKVPVHAVDCTVSVIDKTIPAIIAQKNFVGDFFIGSEKRTITVETEFYAFAPTTDIADFIKKLPKK